MKKLLSIVLFSLATVSAQAAEPSKWTKSMTEAEKVKDLKANYKLACEVIAEHAANVMGMRQDNYDFVSVIDIMEKRTKGTEFEGMVIEAYDTMFLGRVQPAMNDAIRSFSNRWGMKCVKYLRQ